MGGKKHPTNTDTHGCVNCSVLLTTNCHISHCLLHSKITRNNNNNNNNNNNMEHKQTCVLMHNEKQFSRALPALHLGKLNIIYFHNVIISGCGYFDALGTLVKLGDIWVSKPRPKCGVVKVEIGVFIH
ncbi:hypothetical protein TcCL_NonESM00140, partial [Trypanosoma cruzi]